MRFVVERQCLGGAGKLEQNLSEEPIMQMHMDRLLGAEITYALQRERDAVLVEMRLEARGALERSYVELVGILESNFGLVRNGLLHRASCPA